MDDPAEVSGRNALAFAHLSAARLLRQSRRPGDHKRDVGCVESSRARRGLVAPRLIDSGAMPTEPDPLWPPTDPLTASIQARLFALSRIIDASISRMAAEHGLNSGELAILGALKRMGPPHQSTASDLQRAHWVSLPGLMKQLARLEEQGLVAREVDAQDRRRTLVRLTRKAHGLFSRLERRPTDPEFNAIWALPVEERRRIHAALGDLLQAFGAMPGKDD